MGVFVEIASLVTLDQAKRQLPGIGFVPMAGTISKSTSAAAPRKMSFCYLTLRARQNHHGPSKKGARGGWKPSALAVFGLRVETTQRTGLNWKIGTLLITWLQSAAHWREINADTIGIDRHRFALGWPLDKQHGSREECLRVLQPAQKSQLLADGIYCHSDARMQTLAGQ